MKAALNIIKYAACISIIAILGVSIAVTYGCASLEETKAASDKLNSQAQFVDSEIQGLTQVRDSLSSQLAAATTQAAAEASPEAKAELDKYVAILTTAVEKSTKELTELQTKSSDIAKKVAAMNAEIQNATNNAEVLGAAGRGLVGIIAPAAPPQVRMGIELAALAASVFGALTKGKNSGKAQGAAEAEAQTTLRAAQAIKAATLEHATAAANTNVPGENRLVLDFDTLNTTFPELAPT